MDGYAIITTDAGGEPEAEHAKPTEGDRKPKGVTRNAGYPMPISPSLLETCRGRNR